MFQKTGRTSVRGRGVALVLALGCAALLTSCGSDDDGDDAAAAEASNSEAAALLPDDIRSAGVVKVAAQMDYPPEQFYDEDGKTPRGFSVELGDALGEQLGVKFEFENVGFDSILAGITSGRYDVGITSMSVTPERREQVSFVTYFNAGTMLVVAGDNPDDIQGLADMCGRTIANVRGAQSTEYAREYSKTHCEANGEPAIGLQEFAGESPYQAITAGRVDGALRDFTASAYAVANSDGKLAAVGDLIPVEPYGIALAPENTELGKAIEAAMNAIIEDGTYEEILAEWNVEAGAADQAEFLEATG